MLKAFINVFKVKELRDRVLFTAGIIVLVRLAAAIPCPGVDPEALQNYLAQLSSASEASGTVMSFFNMFSGGALEKFAIGTLGIMPYITASIIMQLLVPVVPSLEKIQREGESGRAKINQYTRYLTIAVCVFQGLAAAYTMIDPTRVGLPDPGSSLFVGSESAFVIINVIVLVAVTMMIMWLGEQITERGIGNGASIIITINIIARMPDAVIQLIQSIFDKSETSLNLVKVLLLVVIFLAVTAATVMLTLGYRRIPIQIARKTVGGQLQGGSTYLPLKVNFANVMPIIFAGALMIVPNVVFGWCAQRFSWDGWAFLANTFNYGQAGYFILYALLIIGFSFFWVSTQFNPIQISENLKREGAYIPGIRPGEPTSEFLDNSMTRVTFGGAIFLTALAIFPMLLGQIFNVPPLIDQFFGGTSLLIMVGVTLDTMRQMESHLTMRNYDGFLKSGKLQGRSR